MNANGNGNASSGSKNKRRLSDFFMQNKISVDYHDSDVLRRFLSPEGKILPSRRSGLTSKNQRKLTKAIKRGRMIGLLPFVSSEF
jgi:small subunit ribosomal protein S18